MALDSGNVVVGKTGAVRVGIVGATAPTSATSDISAGHNDLGYISEDGVTEARDRTTNKIKGWQNGDTLREVVTESSFTLAFTMVETREETVELFYGNPVTGASVVVVPSKTGGRKSFVCDVVDDGQTIRIYIPEGEVTEVGEVSYVNGDAVGYPVTISGYATDAIQDDDGNNGTAEIFYSALES